MKIKICGIKYKENLKDIIKLNPDFIGFNFYPLSARYIDTSLSPADLDVIPGKIKKTGIFVNQDEHEVSEISGKYRLDYVQLHGNESADICKSLNSTGLKLIKAFGINKDFNFETLKAYIPWCEFILFDTPTVKYGGSGQKFDWRLLEEYKSAHPFFLSGGIKPEDAHRLMDLSIPALAGFDINSGFESEPGYKDIGLLTEFFKFIKQ